MIEHDIKVLNDLADALIGASGWDDEERAKDIVELLSSNVNIPDLIDTLARVRETTPKNHAAEADRVCPSCGCEVVKVSSDPPKWLCNCGNR